MTIEELLYPLADALAKELLKREGNRKKDLVEVYFTTEELCSKLHVSRATIYRHRKLGYLFPAKYVGRKPLYDHTSIEQYLNKFNF